MSALEALTAAIRAQPGFDPATFDPAALIEHLDDATVEMLMAGILADEERARFNRFADLFPETDTVINGVTLHARSKYPRHMEFFAAGATHRERCFLAGNRTGKTVAGGYEVSCHLTGRYPDWWVGKRFYRPIRAWVAGDTNETVRDTLQLELLGEITFRDNRKTVDGAGLIPRDAIEDPTWKSSANNLIDVVPIRHASGGYSRLGFKSFDQGRRVFQGTAQHLIWLDEECPVDVYGECLIRTMTTGGIVLTTFTPLLGLSKMVLQFLPKDMQPGA